MNGEPSSSRRRPSLAPSSPQTGTERRQKTPSPTLISRSRSASMPGPQPQPQTGGKRPRSGTELSHISSSTTPPQPHSSRSPWWLSTDRNHQPALLLSPSKSTSAAAAAKRRQHSCDRFIPDRSPATATSLLLHNTVEPFGTPVKKPATPAGPRTTGHSQSGDLAKEEAHRVYTQVLKSELFGSFHGDALSRASAASMPPPKTPTTATTTKTTPATTAAKTPQAPPWGSPTRMLHFQKSPTTSVDHSGSGGVGARRRLVFDDAHSAKYSVAPLTLGSQRVLASPRKHMRTIPKVPFKVLDAPELADDFYLNLVDWGSTNVLSVGLGACVYLWSACTSRVTKLCEIGPYDTVTSVNWMQRGTHLAVGTNRGLVQIWDVAKSKKVRTMAGHSARVGTLAWNDQVLSSGSRDRSILHRDMRAPDEFVRKLAGHKQEVCGLKWNTEENLLASGGNDNRLFVWDRMNESPVLRYSEHEAAVKAIAWSPHQRGLLASGGGTADRRIRFWNTSTGSPLQSIDTGSQVCNLSWAKNANEIVSTHGYSQNQVVVWKYPSMQPLATLTGHTFRVLYLALSPDGQTIVTGAGDETLRFWNVFNKPKAKNDDPSALMASSIR